MKVIIAGTGIVKHAGYPLQKDLHTEVFNSDFFRNYDNQCFIKFLKGISNIEYVLSLLDLYILKKEYFKGQNLIFPNISMIGLEKSMRK